MEASLKIGNDIIEPIIQAKIQSAIVEAMGGQAALIEHVVASVLSTHRDREGKVCSKGAYGDNGTFMEIVARKYIEEATKAALVLYFEERKPELMATIQREMKKQNAVLVAAFFDGLKTSAGNAYSTSISFAITPKK